MAKRETSIPTPMGLLPRGMTQDDVPKTTTEAVIAGRIRKLVDMDKFLAERVNDFRHSQQIDTENAALRRLIIGGLRMERETPPVTSKADRDADLLARLKANGKAGGMCSDPVLLQAIADSKDYMVAGIFIPIDPCTAVDRLIDGHPLFIMRAESLGQGRELILKDMTWRVSLARGISIGECLEEAAALFMKKHGGNKPDLKVVPNSNNGE